ncbi:MAG: saccharopine dehydrogenase NADP-binding domain-containing protein [Pseudomonadota bacterium]
MHKVLILGAGKIGALISGLLADSGDYDVQLADADAEAARAVAAGHGLDNVTPFALDATDPAALAAHIAEHTPGTLISSLPFFCNPPVAEAARDAGLHYFDLTEDVAVTEAVRGFAQGADTAFVPQCGLAPGFISIAANELISHFDEVRDVQLRVGALPQHPSNALKYALTWSTDGVINEYANLCTSIVDGEPVQVLPLEGLEEIQIDGTLYEAFNTSGGLGSLAETYRDRVQNMDYKTMRYPGHCEQMRLLMNGLGLKDDRDTLKLILERAVPATLQDVVIVYAAVRGVQGGVLREENYVNKVYPQRVAGRLWSAIQITTASGICAVVDKVLETPGRFAGFVAQEQFTLEDILTNRFGRWYADGGDANVSSLAIATASTGQ